MRMLQAGGMGDSTDGALRADAGAGPAQDDPAPCDGPESDPTKAAITRAFRRRERTAPAVDAPASPSSEPAPTAAPITPSPAKRGRDGVGVPIAAAPPAAPAPTGDVAPSTGPPAAAVSAPPTAPPPSQGG